MTFCPGLFPIGNTGHNTIALSLRSTQNSNEMKERRIKGTPEIMRILLPTVNRFVIRLDTQMLLLVCSDGGTHTKFPSCLMRRQVSRIVVGIDKIVSILRHWQFYDQTFRDIQLNMEVKASVWSRKFDVMWHSSTGYS